MPDLFWLPTGFLPVPVTAVAAVLLVLVANRDKQIKANPPLAKADLDPSIEESADPTASDSAAADLSTAADLDVAASMPPVQLPPQPTLSPIAPNKQRWRRSISFTIRDRLP
ncbi:MAG: hypothetical protein WBA10_13140 [Elainellaceae cyanobacterium]